MLLSSLLYLSIAREKRFCVVEYLRVVPGILGLQHWNPDFDLNHPSMGRHRKIPMELRKTMKQRSVTFVKRRQGLFNKAAYLSILSDAQIAILVRSLSEKEKYYAFTTHHSVDDILLPFLQNQVPSPVDDATKKSAMLLWHKLNTLDNKETAADPTLSEQQEQEQQPWNLREFEESDSVEVLQLLVDELEKLKARFMQLTNQPLPLDFGNAIRSNSSNHISDADTNSCTSIHHIASLGQCDINNHDNLIIPYVRTEQEIFDQAVPETEFVEENYGFGTSTDQYLDFINNGFVDACEFNYHPVMAAEQVLNCSTENHGWSNEGIKCGNDQAPSNDFGEDRVGNFIPPNSTLPSDLEHFFLSGGWQCLDLETLLS